MYIKNEKHECHSSLFFAESALVLLKMFLGNTAQTALANVETPSLGIVTVTFCTYMVAMRYNKE